MRIVHITVAKATALIRLALILAVVIGAVVSYWSSVQNELFEIPGVRAQLRVTSFSTHNDSPIPPRQILHSLTELAHRENGDILIELPTLTGRDAYAAGPQSDQWIKYGYRGLFGSPTVRFVELTELPHHDYRQVIELRGDNSFIQQVENYLTTQSIPFEKLVEQRWQFLLAGTALGDIILLLASLCIALCAIGATLRSHADAVRRLHGYSVMRSAATEFKYAGGYALPLLIGLVGISTIGIGICTNSASALQLAWYLSIFIGTLLFVCFLVLVCTLIVLRLVPLPETLKGKLPQKSLILGMYALRIGVCVATASMSIGLINYSGEWLKQQPETHLWHEYTQPVNGGEVYGMTLSGARNLEEITEASTQLATQVRALSTAHRVLYAQYMDAGIIPHAGLDRDIVVYNCSAAQRSLPEDFLRTFNDCGTSTSLLLITPDSLSPAVDLEKVRQAVSTADNTTWVNRQYVASGITAFTWEVGTDAWMNRAVVTDPIIILFPDDNLALSDKNLIAALTRIDVLFSHYEDITVLEQDVMVGSFIRGAFPLSQQWAYHHTAMGQTVWAYAGGFVAAVVLCLVCSTAVVSTWLRAFHQKLRAHYVFGTAPYSLIATLIGLELSVCALLTYYLWDRGAPARVWSAGGHLEGSADPSLIALFTVPDSVWVFMAVLIIATSSPMLFVLMGDRSFSQLIRTRR